MCDWELSTGLKQSCGRLCSSLGLVSSSLHSFHPRILHWSCLADKVMNNRSLALLAQLQWFFIHVLLACCFMSFQASGSSRGIASHEKPWTLKKLHFTEWGRQCRWLYSFLSGTRRSVLGKGGYLAGGCSVDRDWAYPGPGFEVSFLSIKH